MPPSQTGRAVINATRFLTRKNKKLNLPEFWILCSSCSKLLLGHINALSTIEDWSKRNRSLSKRIPDPCLSSKQLITFCKRRMFVRNFVNKLLKTFCQMPSNKILSRTQKKVLSNAVSLKDDDSSTTRKVRDSFLFNAVQRSRGILEDGSVSFAVSTGRRIDRYIERVGAVFYILFVDPGEELPLERDVDPPHLIKV